MDPGVPPQDAAGARSLAFVADNMELFGFTSSPAGLAQMVKELVDNALDAVRGLQDRPTGVQVNITRKAQTHALNPAGVPIIETAEHSGSLWWLEINVTDNGVGIATANELGVFDSSKRSQGGVGTGTSGRFGVGLIACVIFVSRTSHQAEFTITSCPEGSQEVRICRYSYDPRLKTLNTESEVYSGMNDTASGTQVQVRCLLPKWAVEEAMPGVLEYARRMQLSLLPPCFGFVCDGLWNDTSLCFEHDEAAAPLLTGSQGSMISSMFRDARRAELSEAFRRRVHDYLGYALDGDDDDSLAISVRDEFMLGQPEHTEVMTAVWLDVRTADEEEKVAPIPGDVIRLVNHVPLLDHPDWRSGVVMEACDAVDWTRFGLKLVASMMDDDVGIKAKLELVSSTSEQELQPGDQYIARLMIVVDLVMQTVRFNSAAKTYVVPGESLTRTIAASITASLRQLKQAYPALLRTSAELQDERIKTHFIPGVAGALADMMASSHSVGFQEACLQVLQKPVESIRKPDLYASVLELMEWKARSTG